VKLTNSLHEHQSIRATEQQSNRATEQHRATEQQSNRATEYKASEHQSTTGDSGTHANNPSPVLQKTKGDTGYSLWIKPYI